VPKCKGVGHDFVRLPDMDDLLNFRLKVDNKVNPTPAAPPFGDFAAFAALFRSTAAMDLCHEKFGSGRPGGPAFSLNSGRAKDFRLAAYSDEKACGPGGANLNMAWCVGPSPEQPLRCRETVDVAAAICSSRKARLVSVQGDGHWERALKAGNCTYSFFAWYECACTQGEDGCRNDP